MSLTVEIAFTVNGRPARAEVPPAMSALTMLREVLGMTGTKYACGEGECGACTVLVDGRSVNACLLFAVDCAGRELVTIEGLRSDRGLDPVQQAFVDEGAIQCGFCMPGMIVQARYLLTRHPRPSEEIIRRGLEGNLCRCTGYRKVIDAVIAAATAGDPGE
jgi:carbon-monoxide dehydrogenase small subunit